MAKDKNYVEAIEQLKIAKDFATDTNITKVDNKIKEFEQVAKTEDKYNELMQKAKKLEMTEATWLEAIKVYEEAYNLGFDKITAQNKINLLQNKIKERLKKYKYYIQQFEKGDKQILFNKCESALLICDSNKNKNYYNYFIQKENEFSNKKNNNK